MFRSHRDGHRTSGVLRTGLSGRFTDMPALTIVKQDTTVRQQNKMPPQCRAMRDKASNTNKSIHACALCCGFILLQACNKIREAALVGVCKLSTNPHV
jgi:ribosomal protein L37AE/L43A